MFVTAGFIRIYCFVCGGIQISTHASLSVVVGGGTPAALYRRAGMAATTITPASKAWSILMI